MSAFSTALLDPRRDDHRQAVDAAWRDLVRRVPAEHFGHDPDWFWPVMDWISPPERALRFALVWRDERPVALVPLERRVMGLGPARVRCLGVVAHAAAPLGTALVVDPDHPAAWDALSAGILGADRWWQCFSLEGLCEGSPNEGAIRQRLAPGTLPHARPTKPQYRVEGTAGGRAYFDGQRKKTRQNIRRAESALKRLGRLDYTDSVAGEAPGLAHIEALDEKTWRAETAADAAKNRSLNDYCRTLLHRFPAPERHQLRYLLLDGRPFAANYTFFWGGVAFPIKNGFDPAYAEGSPGMLLLAKVIMEMLDGPVRRIEFMAGNWYAMRLATGLNRECRDLLFRRSNLGLVYGLLARGRAAARRQEPSEAA